MTQKSAGRGKRDELAARAKTEGVVSPYVELQNMYESQLPLFEQYATMAALISHPDVVPFLENPDLTSSLVRGLAAETKDLFQRTIALGKQHAGISKMPNAIDEDENYAIIQMFQQYVAYHGVHNQNIIPIMLQLDEHLNVAMGRKEVAQAAAIASAVAATQTDAALVNAATAEPVQLVQRGGMTSQVDAQGNAVPHAAAPSLDSYEALGATVH